MWSQRWDLPCGALLDADSEEDGGQEGRGFWACTSGPMVGTEVTRDAASSCTARSGTPVGCPHGDFQERDGCGRQDMPVQGVGEKGVMVPDSGSGP